MYPMFLGVFAECVCGRDIGDRVKYIRSSFFLFIHLSGSHDVGSIRLGLHENSTTLSGKVGYMLENGTTLSGRVRTVWVFSSY